MVTEQSYKLILFFQCDPLKSEADFLKKAVMSCRCYKTSLDMDSGLATLWIEYGSFSYMVHSFCSRLLKQVSDIITCLT